MASYSVARAKNTLPDLINKAIAGEEVVITRHGKPVAELRPKLGRPQRSSTSAYEALRRGRDALTPTTITSVALLDALYEDAPES